MVKHAQVLFGQMWPWLPTAILILPLSIYDIVRMSNLFAGPVFRLRKHFAALRNDIACAPLTFREDDYWRDLAAPINDMQAEILRLRSGIMDLKKAVPSTSQMITKSDSPIGAVATQPLVDENSIGIQTSSKLQEDTRESVSESVSESIAKTIVQPSADVNAVAIAPFPALPDSEAPLETPAVVPLN